MKAKDIMVSDVPTVTRKTPVVDALRILNENYGDASFINAAPGLIVVNDQGELVGILSPLSIITALLENAPASDRPQRITDDYFSSLCDKLRDRLVEDVMERQAISVTGEALITDVADLFVKHRFQRIPVIKGKKVIGIIYRSRILFAMTKNLLQDSSIDKNQ